MPDRPIKITTIAVKFSKALVVDERQKEKLRKRIDKYLKENNLPGEVKICFSIHHE